MQQGHEKCFIKSQQKNSNKIKLCIIYLKYRFIFDRKTSCVDTVLTIKKIGKNKKKS